MSATFVDICVDSCLKRVLKTFCVVVRLSRAYPLHNFGMGDGETLPHFLGQSYIGGGGVPLAKKVNVPHFTKPGKYFCWSSPGPAAVL